MSQGFKEGKSYHYSLQSVRNMFLVARHLLIEDKIKIDDLDFDDLMCFTDRGSEIAEQHENEPIYSRSYAQKFLKSNGFNFVKPSIGSDLDPIGIVAFSLCLYGNIIVNEVTGDYLSNLDESPFYLGIDPKYALTFTSDDGTGVLFTVGGKSTPIPGGRKRFTSVVCIYRNGKKEREVYVVPGTVSYLSTFQVRNHDKCFKPGVPIVEGVDFDVVELSQPVPIDSKGDDSDEEGDDGQLPPDTSAVNAVHSTKKNNGKYLSCSH